MDAFTLLTGLLCLLAFALQALDLLPKYRQPRQAISLLLLGVFIGGLLRSFEPGDIRLNLQITGFAVVLGLFATVITVFLLAATFTADASKRGEFYGIAGIGFFVALFVLAAGGIAWTTGESSLAEAQKVTTAELGALAERAVQNRDFDRALIHLRTMEARVQRDSEQAKLLNERIRQLEMHQVK